jgi:Zn-dependent protease
MAPRQCGTELDVPPLIESQATMLRSWKLGQAFGIPLLVHPSFLLLVAWVFYQTGDQGAFTAGFVLAWVLTVFGCVLLHELGHALMARHFGIQTRDITLYPIGGVARLDRLSERSHEELCIALAGPAVNVVIAVLLTPLLIFAAVAGVPFGDPQTAAVTDGALPLLAKLVFGVWISNVGLVIFNLIPAFPMDGGRVLRALLADWLGRVRATDIAGRIGLVLSMVLAVLAILSLNPLLFLVSLFVALVGHQERLMVRYREAQRQAAAPEPVTVASRGFSGVAWDGNHRVWVRWVDGRPVGYYAPAE